MSWANRAGVHVLAHPSAVAFLMAAAVRAVPELLAGNAPIGFDTVTLYLGALARNDPLQMSGGRLFGYANFYLLLQQSANSLLKDPFITLKVLPVLSFGLFSLAVYEYSSGALKAGARTSLLASAFASLSWMTLRISWDLQRNLLGLSLAVIALVALDSPARWKNFAALLMIPLTVWAHPLAGAFLLVVVAVKLLKGLPQRGLFPIAVAASFVLSVVLFTAENYSPETLLDMPSWISPVGFGPGAYLGGLSYFILTGLPLLICALGLLKSGLRRAGTDIWIWVSLVVVLAAFLPLVGVLTVWPFRIWLMMAFPLPILAALGVAQWPKLAGLRVRPEAVALVLMLLVAIPFISLGPDAFGVTSGLGLATYGPSSLQQNVVPVSEFSGLMGALNATRTYASSGYAIVLPTQFVSLALYAGVAESSIVDAGYVGPMYNTTLDQAASGGALGAQRSVTVWWTHPHGWYGSYDIPPGLQRISGNDEFSVYAVRP